MTYPLTYREVTAGEEDLLDAIHALAVENYRPHLACASPPYPSRNELGRMAAHPDRRMHVVHLGDELVAMVYSDAEGRILAGCAKGDEETLAGGPPGATEWGRAVFAAMLDAVKVCSGGRAVNLSRNTDLAAALEAQGAPAGTEG
jgi:hypothetical protein